MNAGDTLRQGVELSATYETSKWNFYANYAYVDATLDTCDQPDGECAFLRQGDRLPGIPAHRFKAGAEYWMTPKWKVGADLVAASDSPFFPNEVSDEDGLNAFLPGYTRVDLHTSYDVTPNFQVYGLVKNLFDQRYGLYGTYFEVDEVSEVDEDLAGPALPIRARFHRRCLSRPMAVSKSATNDRFDRPTTAPTAEALLTPVRRAFAVGELWMTCAWRARNFCAAIHSYTSAPRLTR